MKEKVLASNLFKDKKESYAQSVNVKFKDNRLIDSEIYKNLLKPKQDFVNGKTFMQDQQNEKIIVSIYSRYLYIHCLCVIILFSKTIQGH